MWRYPMGINQKRLNKDDNLNEEMIDWYNKRQIISEIDGIRESIKIIRQKGYKLKINTDASNKDETLEEFDKFLVEDLQNELFRIEESVNKIDRLAHSLKQKNEKVNK